MDIDLSFSSPVEAIRVAMGINAGVKLYVWRDEDANQWRLTRYGGWPRSRDLSLVYLCVGATASDPDAQTWVDVLVPSL